ncbi:transcriptional repressor LexA [Corynebacterium sp. 320]|uniref:LexA repressor n=1 Tax=Corynebacterium zhongnanshanii TaxID=2768834 RepID=A0ABQ6VG54_9CORY|nr:MULTISPECIES: transcriptional repressor LexA [Corynebacterium]KAB1503757.1 transcriptional repressor LexA [Corynebacterium sp. 320]KAB1553143.1 transcriptional repressor LexA [Corynebacterium sp. 321]KAB1553639.1 transcriptional repressor LexA [Corynebacterium sp. 319]KAB3523392.1 transcriptional repressor LexA [Corynebacterium zhongnanshanii]KAB3527893.1 transcriptional repressor LexA [Corynebacterium sp. 250]
MPETENTRATVTPLEGTSAAQSQPRRRRGRPKKTAEERAAEQSASEKGGKATLTARQRRIMEVIRDSTVLRGYPPSIREIADAVGLHSTSSVSYHLTQLEEKGFLKRELKRPRAVDVRAYNQSAEDPSNQPKPGRKPKAAQVDAEGLELPTATYVPVVGQIAAGNPILAEQHVEAHFPLPEELVGSGELFLLQVVGMSMKDAGILDGDWVAVKSQNTAEFGDFVAAMIDDEATVKEFHKDETGLWLLPHNDEFAPIPAEQSTILGKVVAVLRKV